MAKVAFTPNLARHVSCPAVDVAGETVRDVLEVVFSANPQLRGYVLDDRAALRRHMSIFVDGVQVRDRAELSDRVAPQSEVFVAQALSGG